MQPSFFLPARTMKYVRDLYPGSNLPIIDKVLTRRETLNAGRDVITGAAQARILPENPNVCSGKEGN